jgi:hypothetical protein
MNHKVGIWIDHKKAVIVSASANRVTAKTMESEVGPHTRYSVDKFGLRTGKPDSKPTTLPDSDVPLMKRISRRTYRRTTHNSCCERRSDRHVQHK